VVHEGSSDTVALTRLVAFELSNKAGGAGLELIDGHALTRFGDLYRPMFVLLLPPGAPRSSRGFSKTTDGTHRHLTCA
jgi:hypothetical protein